MKHQPFHSSQGFQPRRALRREQLSPRQQRRGSTLMVVMVLLAMLASLGVIFYMFAAQENQSSIYYANAAKTPDVDVTVDTLMNHALRQIIVGPRTNEKNSALYGRRHTLAGNMLGLDTTGTRFDFAPYNGQALDPSNRDPELTGVDFWTINDSPAANNRVDPLFEYPFLGHRDPDYTYPDVNNVFLSYNGFAFGPGGISNGYRVIIPSFHRPQYLRPFGDGWYQSTAGNNLVDRTLAVSGHPRTVGTGQYTLRPHPSHLYVPPPGQQLNANVRRFLNSSDPADQALISAAWGADAIGFPFVPPRDPILGTYAARSSGSGPALGQQGVWSNPLPPNPNDLSYEYDVDNDGDGIYEGIWLDLGFPPLEDETGQLYVPLFSATIIDADALLNLNVHGNLAAVWSGDQSLEAPFLPGGPVGLPEPRVNKHVSRSNLGMTPSEINPVWGLNRRPQLSPSSTNHDGEYGASIPDSFFGSSPLAWYESANREFQFLVQGRYNPSPVDLIPGRWGESELLFSAISASSPRLTQMYAFNTSGSVLLNPWPGPGQTRIDDNGDTQQNTGGWYGSAFTPFGHPVDYTGLGSFYNRNSVSSNAGKLLDDAGSGRLRWPRYTRYSGSSSHPVAWTARTNSITTALFNDPAELVADADNARPEDDLFGPDEMRALHMSPDDFQRATGGTTRLTALAPFNLDATIPTFGTAGSQRFTQEFRSKFTTRSWDRKQFSLPTSLAFLFTADADGDGRAEFPPSFGVTPYGTNDPFRPVLRRLLEIEYENFDRPQYGLRLSLNQLLVGPNGNPFPAFTSNTRPPNIELHYRPLTPHPDPATLDSAAITGFTLNSYPANGNFSSPEHQEYWARVDRQLMARDIFMLLYTLGWPEGMNPADPAFDPSGSTHRARAVRQMAQFAVNVVDSLDRDNISTRFKYDPNPSNGWAYDNNPYHVETGSREVWGVERLDLTLSEALFVHAVPNGDNQDLTFTQWDDTRDQYFAYVELRNPSPNDVNLTGSTWMVEVGPNYLDDSNSDLAQFRRLKLMNGTITSGQVFTIGSANHTVGGNHPSIMKVDTSGGGGSDWDNDQGSWIAPSGRELDLDLKDAADASRYELRDAGNANVPSEALYDHPDDIEQLYVRLYRRAYPGRPSPTTAAEEADNPYLLVDEILITELNADSSSTRGAKLRLEPSDSQIQQKLQGLRSRERGEPFTGNTPTDNDSREDLKYHDTATRANSLGTTNTNSPGTDPGFLHWQRIFDRDFTSVGELLQVSLGGFVNVEWARTNNVTSPGTFATFATQLDNAEAPWVLRSVSTVTNRTYNPTAELFFLPHSTGFGDAHAPNWHRLLELVEVPTRMHVGIPGFPDPIDYPRVPGKMNVNMLRHPEALAAMIDDPAIMHLRVDDDVNFTGTATQVFHPPLLSRLDDSSGAIDDWWRSFLRSRDGFRDPATGSATDADPITNLYLPGWAIANDTTGTYGSATPFRAFSAVANGDRDGDGTTYRGHAVEQTLLRSWPDDQIPQETESDRQGDALNPRQLFELGSREEHIGEPPFQKLDPFVRRRILNKLMNYSTTRSNVFVVFISVKYFRALEDGGAVRIGGPLREFQDTSGLPLNPPDRTDAGWQPEHRGFFIVDRSQIEKAYDRATGNVDFRGLVEFRQILE